MDETIHNPKVMNLDISQGPPADEPFTSWSYWGEVPPAVQGMTIPDWFDVVHQRWPHFKLSIAGMSNDNFSHRLKLPAKLLLERIPREMLFAHLVSFEVKDLSRLLCSELGLQEILAESFQLRTLRLQSNDCGYELAMRPRNSEKPPPLERLCLFNYHWFPPNREVVGDDNPDWDLSNLNHLELRQSNTRFFFHSVAPSSLTHLRSLKVDSWPRPGPEVGPSDLLEQEYQHATELRKAIDNIHALEELRITCWLSAMPLSTITRHGATLRSLQLHDHGWIGSCSIITEDYLGSICSSCPLLMILSLNLKDCNFEVLLRNDPRIADLSRLNTRSEGLY